MNKSKFAALLLSLAGFAAAAPAEAQSFYFGGSLGNTKAQKACASVQQDGSACNSNDQTWAGNVGFMFTPYWGMELAYRDFGKIVEVRNADGTTAEWKTKSGEVVLVGALPINRLTIYGKFGGYYAKTKLTSDFLANADASNRQWTGGAGIAYDLFKHLRVRAEYQIYNNLGAQDVGLRTDVKVISGGLLLVF